MIWAFLRLGRSRFWVVRLGVRLDHNFYSTEDRGVVAPHRTASHCFGHITSKENCVSMYGIWRSIGFGFGLGFGLGLVFCLLVFSAADPSIPRRKQKRKDLIYLLLLLYTFVIAIAIAIV